MRPPTPDYGLRRYVVSVDGTLYCFWLKRNAKRFIRTQSLNKTVTLKDMWHKGKILYHA